MGKVHWGGCNQLRLAQPPPGCMLIFGHSPCCFHSSRLRPQQAPHAPTSSYGSARRIRCTFALLARKRGVTFQVLSPLERSSHCCAIDNAEQTTWVEVFVLRHAKQQELCEAVLWTYSSYVDICKFLWWWAPRSHQMYGT